MTDFNLPRIPDSIDIQRLQAMQLVAKMKESAEKHGIGFIGGFISPDGQKFVMTNMDDDDAMALMPEDLKWLLGNWQSLSLLVFCASQLLSMKSFTSYLNDQEISH